MKNGRPGRDGRSHFTTTAIPIAGQHRATRMEYHPHAVESKPVVTATDPAPGADPFYVPKSIKRLRRTKATIAGIRTAIIDILSEDHPQTVRQVFYALTVRGKLAKHEAEYHGNVL